MTRGPIAAGLAAVLLGVPWAPNAAADDLARGRVVFRRCVACHSVDPQEKSLPGPNLFGIVGRHAGNDPGHDYSPVLRAARRDGLIWTEAALDLYLMDTEAFLPGTVMGFQKIDGADDRRALIAFLKAGDRR